MSLECSCGREFATDRDRDNHLANTAMLHVYAISASTITSAATVICSLKRLVRFSSTLAIEDVIEGGKFHALMITNSPPQPRNMYEYESEISTDSEEEEEESFVRSARISREWLLTGWCIKKEEFVKSSPERFSTQIMVAPNSTEDIHEDIYDWEQEWMQHGILPDSSPGLPAPPQALRLRRTGNVGLASALELSLDAIPAGALPLTISPGAFRAPFALAEDGVLRELESSPPRRLGDARGGGALAPALMVRRFFSHFNHAYTDTNA
ncbi:hypothetical protein DFH09DRAFT_1370820 [Mycena vulgaris]|nr:hypothetical protein DFH09DRAFT_1370820 [Mycena vulgaris]